MNNITALILVIASLGMADEQAFAKREAPKEVDPVVFNGVKYTAPHWGLTEGRRQNGGYIEARDVKTGDKLWGLQVYKVKYDPNLERDVQDVFITSLSIRDGKLLVVNERGARYEVDTEKRTVKELPPKEA